MFADSGQPLAFILPPENSMSTAHFSDSTEKAMKIRATFFLFQTNGNELRIFNCLGFGSLFFFYFYFYFIYCHCRVGKWVAVGGVVLWVEQEKVTYLLSPRILLCFLLSAECRLCYFVVYFGLHIHLGRKISIFLNLIHVYVLIYHDTIIHLVARRSVSSLVFKHFIHLFAELVGFFI